MNIGDEDLLSDSDSDDCDYRPEKDSGSESIDEKDEISKNIKKTSNPIKKKHRKRRNKQIENEIEAVEGDSNKLPTNQDPEKEKQRVDALWADFLSGTEIPLHKKDSSSTKIDTKSKTNIPKEQESYSTPVPKIFEFAGETIEVSPNNTKNSSSSSNPVKPTIVPTTSLGIKRSSIGGLSSVLSQFSKKNKLSVLEKTKLDWDGFKSKEGINEELKTHNRGREG